MVCSFAGVHSRRPDTPYGIVIDTVTQGFPNLRAFLDFLRRAGQLATVDAPVDPRLEAAEIHRRVIAAGGPALLFTHPRGADFPLVTNLFGTAERARAAFGPRPFRLVGDLVRLAHSFLPPSAATLWAARGTLWRLARLGTRRVRRGPVADVITGDPRLDRLPALTCWPEDAGPFLTLPLVYTEHPDHGGHNLGMYRMQVFDPRTTGMHIQIVRGGGFHHAAAETRGRPLPATVFLGGPPAITLAAIAPLPENVSELLLASAILGGRLPMCRPRALPPHPHPLAAEAEFALLGDIPAGERRAEGPFGDHYGYYSLRHDFPIFRVKTIARRRDAIFPATLVGTPRQEDFFIGDLLQELLAPLFPLVMPGVERLWAYGETGYHSLAAAVVRERYGREAMASAFRILGEGQLALTKFLLVTDRHVDLRDIRAVLEHLLARTNPETDLFVIANLAMDTLDYTGPDLNQGSKGVWLALGDAARALPRRFAPPCSPPDEVRDPRVFCGGCLVLGGPAAAKDRDFPARLAAHPAFAGWPLMVLVDDPARTCASPVNFLWTTFTRFEPARDLYAARTRVVRNHVARTPPIVIDARLKPGFPRELFCDEHTAALVTRRWREYFPASGPRVEMGDSNRAHLAPAAPG
ncbi:MAG: UbiD family decarboxylase [Planctomycetes bacterium]|nr:UbiD family decarboxylase [Planctomycetota bacterium]